MLSLRADDVLYVVFREYLGEILTDEFGSEVRSDCGWVRTGGGHEALVCQDEVILLGDEVHIFGAWVWRLRSSATGLGHDLIKEEHSATFSRVLPAWG